MPDQNNLKSFLNSFPQGLNSKGESMEWRTYMQKKNNWASSIAHMVLGFKTDQFLNIIKNTERVT